MHGSIGNIFRIVLFLLKNKRPEKTGAVFGHCLRRNGHRRGNGAIRQKTLGAVVPRAN